MQNSLIANASLEQLARVKEKMIRAGIIRFPQLFDLVVAEARKREANANAENPSGETADI